MANTYLAGHSDLISNSFKFSLSEHSESLIGKEVPELRVMTWNSPPFLYGASLSRDLVNNSVEEFIHLSGPLYSLMREVALKLNYSLVVQWTETDENIYGRYLTFIPHFLVYPWVYSTGFIEEMGFMTDCKQFLKLDFFIKNSLIQINY